MSDDEARPAQQGGGGTAPQAAPEVMDGIRSLRDRIDELQRLVTQRVDSEGGAAGTWLQARAGTALHAARAVPAFGVRGRVPRRCRVRVDWFQAPHANLARDHRAH